ncbi:MAG TPA: alpha/beta fold hydrolase [Thermoanaerobaculia bacterium]|nr:alpha/beta fold hydrolase [Thermoanaerobaculia bacterium]
MNRSRDFQLSSGEGLPILGTLTLPSTPAHALVVIIHGFKGFRNWGFFPWMADAFAKLGIASCRFDMSRNGVEHEEFTRLDLFEDDTYSIELADLRVVLAYIEKTKALSSLPLFLLGHSRGGSIAILGARLASSRLTGVITWSSISQLDRWDAKTRAKWRKEGAMMIENQRTKQKMRVSTAILDDLERNAASLEIEAAMRSLEKPILLVHGKKDDSVPWEEVLKLASWKTDSSILLVGSGTHTYGAIHPLVHVPSELELVMTVTGRFVQNHI